MVDGGGGGGGGGDDESDGASEGRRDGEGRRTGAARTTAGIDRGSALTSFLLIVFVGTCSPALPSSRALAPTPPFVDPTWRPPRATPVIVESARDASPIADPTY